MKKISLSLSLLSLVFAQLAVVAQEDDKKDKKYEFVKNKSINKSYNVSASDKLSIRNSFGSVEVHTWTKNEIKVNNNNLNNIIYFCKKNYNVKIRCAKLINLK